MKHTQPLLISYVGLYVLQQLSKAKIFFVKFWKAIVKPTSAKRSTQQKPPLKKIGNLRIKSVDKSSKKQWVFKFAYEFKGIEYSASMELPSETKRKYVIQKIHKTLNLKK